MPVMYDGPGEVVRKVAEPVSGISGDLTNYLFKTRDESLATNPAFSLQPLMVDYQDGGDISPNATMTHTLNVPSGKTYFVFELEIASSIRWFATITAGSATLWSPINLQNTTYTKTLSKPLALVGPTTLTIVKQNLGASGDAASIYSSISYISVNT